MIFTRQYYITLFIFIVIFLMRNAEINKIILKLIKENK